MTSTATMDLSKLYLGRLPVELLVYIGTFLENKKFRLYRTVKGESFRRSVGGFSPDGRWIVSSNEIWDFQNDPNRKNVKALRDNRWYDSASSSPNSRWVVSTTTYGDGDGAMRLIRILDAANDFDSSSRKTLRGPPEDDWTESSLGNKYSKPSHKYKTTTASFSPDSRWFVACKGTKDICIYNAQKNFVLIKTLETRLSDIWKFYPTDRVNCAHFSSNGRWIVAASKYVVSLYDVRNDFAFVKELTNPIPPNAFPPKIDLTSDIHPFYPIVVNTVFFSPNSRWVVSVRTGSSWVSNQATGHYNPLRVLYIYDTTNKFALIKEVREIFVVSNRSGKCCSGLGLVSFSPDSRWIAVRSDNFIRVFDAENNFELSKTLLVERGSVQSRLCFSRDGRFLASNCGGTISMFSVANDFSNIETPPEMSTFWSDLSSDSFSPDGRWFVLSKFRGPNNNVDTTSIWRTPTDPSKAFEHLLPEAHAFIMNNIPGKKKQ